MKSTLRHERIRLNMRARPASLETNHWNAGAGHRAHTAHSEKPLVSCLSTSTAAFPGIIFDGSNSLVFCPSFSLLRVLGVDLKEGMGQEIAGNNRADPGILCRETLGFFFFFFSMEGWLQEINGIVLTLGFPKAFIPGSSREDDDILSILSMLDSCTSSYTHS